MKTTKNETRPKDKKDVEALLFVSKEALEVEKIVKLIDDEDVDANTVVRWLFELKNEYSNRGIHIRQVAGGFEMVSSQDCYEVVEKIVPKEYEHDLSKASLLTLAIIIDNQPIIRAHIAKKRGVKNSDHTVQTLLDMNLIKDTEEGFVTTEHFLRYFGVNDIKELKEQLTEMKLDRPIDTEEQEKLSEEEIQEDENIEEIEIEEK